MRPLVEFPDPEAIAAPLVAELLAAEISAGTCTASVGTPDGWSARTSPLHVVVAWDGTPRVDSFVAARNTIRITVKGSPDAPSAVKALALRLQGLVAAQPMVRLLAGPTPSTDADGTEMASFTFRLTTRSRPLSA